MSQLDKLFEEQPEQPLLPEIERLKEMRQLSGARRLRCEFSRDRDGLGFKPSRFRVLFSDAKNAIPSEIMSWDLRLDDWLIQNGVAATSLENEAARFGFGLRERFEPIEIRYGGGFFNGVLIEYLRETELAKQKSIKQKLDSIHAYAPASCESSVDCQKRVEHVISTGARNLVNCLSYERPVAVEVLSRAIAYYLDERFNITTRKMLGFG